LQRSTDIDAEKGVSRHHGAAPRHSVLLQAHTRSTYICSRKLGVSSGQAAARTFICIAALRTVPFQTLLALGDTGSQYYRNE